MLQTSLTLPHADNFTADSHLSNFCVTCLSTALCRRYKAWPFRVPVQGERPSRFGGFGVNCALLTPPPFSHAALAPPPSLSLPSAFLPFFLSTPSLTSHPYCHFCLALLTYPISSSSSFLPTFILCFFNHHQYTPFSLSYCFFLFPFPFPFVLPFKFTLLFVFVQESERVKEKVDSGPHVTRPAHLINSANQAPRSSGFN